MVQRKLLMFSDIATSKLKEFKKLYKSINGKKINEDDAVSMIIENLDLTGMRQVANIAEGKR